MPGSHGVQEPPFGPEYPLLHSQLLFWFEAGVEVECVGQKEQVVEESSILYLPAVHSMHAGVPTAGL